MHVDHVEVGVVDGGSCALEPHLVLARVPLGVEGRLGDVEERVDQRTLARVLAAQDYQRTVVELTLRTRLVQKLGPHAIYILSTTPTE